MPFVSYRQTAMSEIPLHNRQCHGRRPGRQADTTQSAELLPITESGKSPPAVPMPACLPACLLQQRSCPIWTSSPCLPSDKFPLCTWACNRCQLCTHNNRLDLPSSSTWSLPDLRAHGCVEHGGECLLLKVKALLQRGSRYKRVPH